MLAKLTTVSFIKGTLFLKRFYPKVLVLQYSKDDSSAFTKVHSQYDGDNEALGAHREPVVTCVVHNYLRNASADVIDRVTKAGRDVHVAFKCCRTYRL